MSFPLLPLALGGVALYALHQKSQQPQFSTVQAKSGRKWLTRTLGVTGSGPTRKTTIEVWAPAGMYGPHQTLLVATYTQTGSDTNSRVALSTGPQAVATMITDAGKDFGIKKPTAAAA
jgi:hypothetical protein